MTTISDSETRPRRPQRPPLKRQERFYVDKVDELQNVLKGIPDRPTKNLMTYEELQQKIGSKPKKNRFGGKVKMSERYKAIGNKLDAVKTTLATATLAQINQDGGRDAFELLLNQQLDEIVTAGNRYKKKHTGKKGAAVQQLLDDVERFRKEIPGTLDLLTDGELPDGLGLDNAMAAKRAGITPAQLKGVSPKHCNFNMVNDDTRDQAPKVLGRGAVNTVDLIKHGGVERVFKEEKSVDKSQAWAPAMLGIDVANDPRYGNRNIAGSIVGKLLGTGVMPESSFGISDGKVGLLMQKANGKTANKFIEDGDDGDLTPKAQASLQRQLADLEVCDILTGQTDRHPGNYMVDVQGDKVTVVGIDNDFSFPNLDNSPMGGKDKIPFVCIATTSIKNMPALIDKATADRVKAIDFDRDMAPGFADLLNANEIKFAKTRFTALYNHVLQLEQDGCIVTDWETWRGPPPERQDAGAYLARSKSSSLMKRDFF